ncbi:hypothetical protein BJY01DRAFT_263261 [Aspergillus pseudoustus]|uniref:Cortical protein marker for cell polarity-domain-containing protein n=1 Tax=Aspergillus pseudoustus TaxID=1810923 RepID=A0ABR4K3R8_9EURO
MAAQASNLSKTNCDFVVATTQASINAGLLEYLDEESQPEQYICFVKPGRNDPLQQLTLDELMAKTGGVNPFYIEDSPSEDDERVGRLRKAHFQVGVMLQMGIPEGFTPASLPSIATLNTAGSVLFNLFCKKVKVVSLEYTEWGIEFHSVEQPKGPSGIPWSMKMSVDLTIADLDKELNTSYLNSHPDVKAQLRKALDNISGTAFSLQQLLFDLDNAILQTAPDFSAVHDKQAKFVLEEYFRDIYVKGAKEQGLPLVAVTAVSQEADPSSLHMTGFERTVTKVDANNGEASTLNYLCVVNNHPVPSPSTSFDWNWVSPDEINQASGVVAINRGILAKHIAEKLEPMCAENCYVPSFNGRGNTLTLVASRKGPTVTFPPVGDKAIQFSYQDREWGTAVGVALDGSARAVPILIEPSYECEVRFRDNRIHVNQTLEIEVWYETDWRDGELLGGIAFSPVHMGFYDGYEISTGDTGALQLTRTYHNPWDKSQTKQPEQQDAKNAQIYEYLNLQFRDQISDLTSNHLHSFRIGEIQNFILPGARAFTYKDPVFSHNQDLICKITYVDAAKVSPIQDPLQSQPIDDQPAAPEPRPSSNPSLPAGKLTASTALMQNYIQGELISPSGRFRALQTGDGHGLLFAIDSAGVFRVIEEQSGTLHTGWKVHDLSTAAIQVQFPGELRAVVRTFDVGQSVVDGSIGLMMAVQLDGNDHLFFSLGNSNQDLSWVTSGEHWTMVPFDPVNEASQKITVCGAMFAETAQQVQYLVVDIDRPSKAEADPHIARYHIDSTCKTSHYWIKHDVTIDLAASKYQSAVGRIPGKRVDGIYTAGTSATGGGAQLVYEPIINEYRADAPVEPVRLQLPGGATPSSIATAHSSMQDGSTDLYVVAGSTMYCFAADEQKDMSLPLALCTSDFLAGTGDLVAVTHEGITTLWGRNRSYEVYYLSCPTNQVLDPAAWSVPVPILTGIEHMSAYVNRAEGENTIFAVGNGGRIERVVQGTVATGRVWRAHQIAIAAPPQQPCTSIRSYTTAIHVTELESSSPIPKAAVQLSASSRTPVYINGLYYVLSPMTPILVTTDASGSLTVVEATDGLQGAVLTASLANATLTINPMDNSMAKLAALDSAEKLRGVRVPTEIVAGGVVESTQFTPLMDPSAQDDDLDAVAYSLALFKDAYSKVPHPPTAGSTTQASLCRDHQSRTAAANSMLSARVPKTTNFSILDKLGKGFKVLEGDVTEFLGSVGDMFSGDFGDIFQLAKNAGETVGQLFRDAGTGAMHLFMKYKNKFFHAVLNTWNAFIGSAEWVFKKFIEIGKRFWAYTDALFQWPDIRRTKDVTHNVVRLCMQHYVDQIPKIAQQADQAIIGLEQKINHFAGIADFSPLDDSSNVLKKRPTDGAGSPYEGQTPESLLLANSFRDHGHQLTITGGSSANLDGVEGLLNDLVTAISKGGAVLGAVFDELQKLVQDFSSLSVEDILKRLMGILADAVLSSVQVVVDALLKVVQTVAQSLLDVLDTKIHIPVISDILNKIGVPDLSFLDLFTWIIAMAYTVVYKVTNDKQAPFPAHDQTTAALISARSWEEITAVFSGSSSSSSSFAARSSQLATSSSAPETYWFIRGHALAGLVGIPLVAKNMLDAEGEGVSTGVAIGGFVLTVIGGLLQGSANLLSPRDPIADDSVSNASIAILVIRLACLGYFSGAFATVTSKIEGKFPKLKVGNLQPDNAQGVGAIVDTVLVLPSIAVTIWHVVELAQRPAGKTRSAAILEECGNVVSYIQRASSAIALNDPEPDSKEIAVGLTGATTLIAAGFQIAEAATC